MATIIMEASQREQLIAIAPTEKELLLDAYVQPYPRVSTPEQKKNMSAEMQQDKKFALLCGWKEHLIIWIPAILAYLDAYAWKTALHFPI